MKRLRQRVTELEHERDGWKELFIEEEDRYHARIQKLERRVRELEK